jgi:hypothetical protein
MATNPRALLVYQIVSFRKEVADQGTLNQR